MATNSRRKPVNTQARPSTISRDSSASSVKSPRTPRFAEATAIISPVEPSAASRHFARPLTSHFVPQRQPVDMDDYEKHASVQMEEVDLRLASVANPGTPLMSPPLKSALKTPGTSRPQIFSPTFHEEETLDKAEKDTDKEQAKDLKIKTRVRMAKILLRGVNFSCSLIVLSMLTATFTIFNATKTLPPRLMNSTKFPPWAAGQATWPQITILVIACISLALSMAIFWGYSRGGHRRAQKAAIYYTTFAVATFVFSTVMWLVGAAVLQHSKAAGNKQDMWGWSCNQNTRATLFQQDVNYALICRMQNWSLVCAIIEIVVELITISVYGIIFWRYFSKRRLRKSMVNRNKARSDLYLAQLRSQSAPNTPGLNPYTPRGDYKVNPYEMASTMENGPVDDGTQFVDASRKIAQPKPFVLQPPPVKIQGATPKMQQTGFTPISIPTRTPSPPSRTYSPPQRAYSPPAQTYSSAPQSFSAPPPQQVEEHFEAAPGEEVYEAVPIPGAYVHPASPRGAQFPNYGW